MYAFLALMRAWLNRQAIEHTESMDDSCDVLFVNSWVVDYQAIRRRKKKQPDLIVVQRVDGSAKDYGRRGGADGRQARVNLLADLTIFQSTYSRHSTSSKFRVIRHDGPVIHNPVDSERFNPTGPLVELPGQLRLCNASFSTNRMKGTWRIGEIARANPEVTFVLCGRYPMLPALPNIKLMGHLGKDELARTMRSCHIYLQLSQNEACPNVVLEAMASGLPVLYTDSGGTPELVGEAGLPLDDRRFGEQIQMMIANRPSLSATARERAVKLFNPDVIFPQYMAAILRAERRELPSLADLVRLRLEGYPVLPPLPLELLRAVPARMKRKMRGAVS